MDECHWLGTSAAVNMNDIWVQDYLGYDIHISELLAAFCFERQVQNLNLTRKI
jgi:hypothetical protein